MSQNTANISRFWRQKINSFYVELVSTASKHEFPMNRPDFFTNRLPEPIVLYDKWEVGLTDIHFPRQIIGRKKCFEFQIAFARKFTYEKNHEFTDRWFSVDFDEEETIYSFLKKLNKQMKHAIKKWIDHDESPFFRLEDDNKISLTTCKFRNVILVPICSNPEFYTLLGFKPETINFDDNTVKTIKADRECIIDISPNFMFVCCDFAKSHLAGSSYSHSLRSVPFEKSDIEKTASVTFARPFYFPVTENVIDKMKIMLYNQFHEAMKFKSGDVRLTLHFRKIYKEPINQNYE